MFQFFKLSEMTQLMILCGWIGPEALCRFDSAVCNSEQRKNILALFQKPAFIVVVGASLC